MFYKAAYQKICHHPTISEEYQINTNFKNKTRVNLSCANKNCKCNF